MYNKKEAIEQIINIIEQNEICFFDDIPLYVSPSKGTLYEWKLNKSERIIDAIEKQRIKSKLKHKIESSPRCGAIKQGFVYSPYEINNFVLRSTDNSFAANERRLEEHIVDKIADISSKCFWSDIKKVERQFLVKSDNGQFIIDIMLWHTDGTATMIEVKKSRTNRRDWYGGISQLLFYGHVIEKVLDNKCRLVLASDSISKNAMDMIKHYSLPINLLMLEGDNFWYHSR